MLTKQEIDAIWNAPNLMINTWVNQFQIIDVVWNTKDRL